VLELLELTPEGVLVSLFEQPVFGTVKDVKVLKCKFSEPLFFDSENGNVYYEFELSSLSPNKKQCLRVITGQDVLDCVSDSGYLSFLVYTECPYYLTNDIDNSQHHHHNKQKKHNNEYKGKGKNISSIIGTSAENSRKSGRFQPIKEVKKIFYHQLFII